MLGREISREIQSVPTFRTIRGSVCGPIERIFVTAVSTLPAAVAVPRAWRPATGRRQVDTSVTENNVHRTRFLPTAETQRTPGKHTVWH